VVHFVPFDGSRLAESALLRAAAYADLVDTPVHAHVVIPRGNAEYAREHGWLDRGADFDIETVVVNVREAVTDLVPAAAFDYDVVNRHAPRGVVAKKLRESAIAEGATVVFVGSENAGRVVGPMTTVGSSVVADDRYDVHIVRQELPRQPREGDGRAARSRRSDFWLP
jgi:nucleotide-binding universal stress UspA family protein